MATKIFWAKLFSWIKTDLIFEPNNILYRIHRESFVVSPLRTNNKNEYF